MTPSLEITTKAAPDPAVEIVTFRLADATSADAFLTAARDTEATLRRRGTLTRRVLTVDEEGLWTDIVEWTSQDAAQAAAEAVMSDPSFQPFLMMIDPDTVSMRHASILWRME